VLAFDDTIVAAALGDSTGLEGQSAGLHYLEKIVQVPLRLPPADQSVLFDITLRYLNEVLEGSQAPLPQSNANSFLRYFKQLFDARTRTLRAAKRYANALRFALPLLEGEVDLSDLLLIEAIRTFYPDLHGQIRTNDDLFLGAEGFPRDNGGAKERNRARFLALLESYLPLEREALAAACEYLFPMLKQVTGNWHFGADSQEEWERGQRISSRNYFARYFLYAVPRGDLADAQLSHLRRVLDAGDNAAARALLQTLCSSSAGARTIHKLRLYEETLSARAAETLIDALAVAGAHLPKSHELFASVLSPDAQGATLAYRALGRVLPERRQALAVDLLNRTPSLTFAVAFSRRLMRGGSAGSPAMIGPEGLPAVKLAMITRLKQADEEQPLYLRTREDAGSLMAAWGFFVPRSERVAVLRQRLESAPETVPAFVASFAPTAWNSSGLPALGDFERDSYNALGEHASPEEIYELLLRTRPEFIRPPAFADQGGTGNSLPGGLSGRRAWGERVTHSGRSANLIQKLGE
jgi:hypothetical protein